MERICLDCEAILDECTAQRTREYVPFLRQALNAASDGHVAAAQSLASNTLDSMMYTAFDQQERASYTSHKATKREDVDGWPLRTFLAMAPIWHAHERFEPTTAQLIPRSYVRHATTHAVSRRQYSRRNTAQALILSTGLAAYLNDL